MNTALFPLTLAVHALWSCHALTGSRIKWVVVGFYRPSLVPFNVVERSDLFDGVLVV